MLSFNPIFYQALTSVYDQLKSNFYQNNSDNTNFYLKWKINILLLCNIWYLEKLHMDVKCAILMKILEQTFVNLSPIYSYSSVYQIIYLKKI